MIYDKPRWKHVKGTDVHRIKIEYVVMHIYKSNYRSLDDYHVSIHDLGVPDRSLETDDLDKAKEKAINILKDQISKINKELEKL